MKNWKTKFGLFFFLSNFQRLSRKTGYKTIRTASDGGEEDVNPEDDEDDDGDDDDTERC